MRGRGGTPWVRRANMRRAAALGAARGERGQKRVSGNRGRTQAVRVGRTAGREYKQQRGNSRGAGESKAPRAWRVTGCEGRTICQGEGAGKVGGAGALRSGQADRNNAGRRRLHRRARHWHGLRARHHPGHAVHMRAAGHACRVGAHRHAAICNRKQGLRAGRGGMGCPRTAHTDQGHCGRRQK